MRLGNNPLARKSKPLSFEEKKDVIVKHYGRLMHVTKELIKKIDFSDKTFINRIYETDESLDLKELKESIDKIGLLNIVYLQEKDNSQFRIISGLRRISAVKELYQEDKEVKAKDRVVILQKNTPYEMLDTISVDENTKRKNLSILEQSYKFNREAKRKNKKVEDIVKEYNISKKNYYRIKNAINYPYEIREIIEVLGASKAELLNRLVKKLGNEYKTQDIVNQNKNLSRDELREKLKNLNKSDKISLKYTQKGFNFSVKKKLPKDVVEYFEKIKDMLNENDFSFMK